MTDGPRWKPLAIFGAVFLFGAVAGGASTRAYTLAERETQWGTPEARIKSRVELMRKNLDLNDEQTSKVEKIIRDSSAEREKNLEPCRPKLDEIRDRTDSQIRDVLSNDQRVKYDDFRERWKRRGP